jgi:hypothetical protein
MAPKPKHEKTFALSPKYLEKAHEFRAKCPDDWESCASMFYWYACEQEIPLPKKERTSGPAKVAYIAQLLSMPGERVLDVLNQKHRSDDPFFFNPNW